VDVLKDHKDGSAHTNMPIPLGMFSECYWFPL